MCTRSTIAAAAVAGWLAAGCVPSAGGGARTGGSDETPPPADVDAAAPPAHRDAAVTSPGEPDKGTPDTSAEVDSASEEPDAAAAVADAAVADAAPDQPRDGSANTGPAVVWQNEGTAAPWGHLLKDPGCTLTEVSTPTYKGTSALKHVVNYPSTVKLSVHCEVARDPVGQPGDDLYYGWAFQLGDDWPDSYDRKSVISQMTGRGKCWNQLDFFTLTGLTLNDEGAGGPDSCAPMDNGAHPIAQQITKNVWHRVVLHKIWKGDQTGLLEIWFDGVKATSARGISTGFGDMTTGYAWHVGVYAGVDADRVGSRTIYTDHFRVARTYRDAEPANWNEP